MEVSAERLARNQALFREVNERLNEIGTSRITFSDFVCECSDVSCTKTLLVAPGEYETVRSIPKRFMVARGHELPEIERVVDNRERFLIVEKKIELQFMAETDPRSSGEEDG